MRVFYPGTDILTRIEKNEPENVVERSALSTRLALLYRAAIYSGREATW